MNISVNRAKIVVPRRRSNLLNRKRLLDMLTDILDYRLTLVSAPAGYGKTSLLIDFAHQEEYPICWYALEDCSEKTQAIEVSLAARRGENARIAEKK